MAEGSMVATPVAVNVTVTCVVAILPVVLPVAVITAIPVGELDENVNVFRTAAPFVPALLVSVATTVVPTLATKSMTSLAPKLIQFIDIEVPLITKVAEGVMAAAGPPLVVPEPTTANVNASLSWNRITLVPVTLLSSTAPGKLPPY